MTPSPSGSGNPDLPGLVRKYALQFGIRPELAFSIWNTENPRRDPGAISKKGAVGHFQLMPRTAKELGVTDPTDPEQNIRGGLQYFAQLRNRFQDDALALAAYNAGPTPVRRYKGIPPYRETQEYVRRILARTQMLEETRRRLEAQPVMSAAPAPPPTRTEAMLDAAKAFLGIK